jgi:CRISPR-associated endonuclease Cas1
MAATHTLAQVSQSHNSSIEVIVPRHGVVTLSGYGVEVRVDRGHLLLTDGIGPNRRSVRLPRVGHGLSRLVVIGSDGVVSLAALRWLADQDAAFTMLEREGKVLAVIGPVRPSDAKLRRAQALAHSSGAALRITRDLIQRKLRGQENVARYKLLDDRTGDVIASYGAQISSTEDISTIRLLEAQGAAAYWSAWRDLPVQFPKNDQNRVPAHWKVFGTRKSALTGSPRLATNPPNGILNYLYSLLESESRLAAAAMGLDPGLGVLHADTTARDSLACDLMEPVRPCVDAYLLDWITRQPLRREWFFEEANGNCRLRSIFASQLSETIPTWSRLVAPIAEWVARAFWDTIRRPNLPITTRLTQSNKRKEKDQAPSPTTPASRPENACLACGQVIASDSSRCVSCTVEVSRERLIEVARQGRTASRTAHARARVGATQRRQHKARRNWQPSMQPDWLTEDTYSDRIIPLLKNFSRSQIASALDVSIPYAAAVRAGRRRPHPRHRKALAKLVGVSG